MKVAVSIPDDVFAEAEALARRTRQSRSRLYAKAIESYVAANGGDDLTRRFDAILAQAGDDETGRAFTRAGAVTALRHSEW